jgi:hypothetical protein
MQRVSKHFRDGVRFVDLSALRDPELEESLRISRELSNLYWIGRAGLYLGLAVLRSGDCTRAHSLLADSLLSPRRRATSTAWRKFLKASCAWLKRKTNRNAHFDCSPRPRRCARHLDYRYPHGKACGSIRC